MNIAQLTAGTTLADWHSKHAQPAEKAPDAILRVLGEAGYPIDSETLAERTDFDHQHIRSVLPRLVNRGQVLRHGQRSKYSRYTYELKGSNGR